MDVSFGLGLEGGPVSTVELLLQSQLTRSHAAGPVKLLRTEPSKPTQSPERLMIQKQAPAQSQLTNAECVTTLGPQNLKLLEEAETVLHKLRRGPREPCCRAACRTGFQTKHQHYFNPGMLQEHPPTSEGKHCRIERKTFRYTYMYITYHIFYMKILHILPYSIIIFSIIYHMLYHITSDHIPSYCTTLYSYVSLHTQVQMPQKPFGQGAGSELSSSTEALRRRFRLRLRVLEVFLAAFLGWRGSL